MKILSAILGILAIINCILIIMSGMGKISKLYLVFGGVYAVCHLTYQAIRKEGVFR
jgi:hypothetical protein